MTSQAGHEAAALICFIAAAIVGVISMFIWSANWHTSLALAFIAFAILMLGKLFRKVGETFDSDKDET